MTLSDYHSVAREHSVHRLEEKFKTYLVSQGGLEETPERQYLNIIESKFYVNTPLRATVFFLMLAIASSGIAVLPSFNIGATLTSSHTIGTYWAQAQMECVGNVGTRPTLAALYMLFTDSEISGPIPGSQRESMGIDDGSNLSETTYHLPG